MNTEGKTIKNSYKNILQQVTPFYNVMKKNLHFFHHENIYILITMILCLDMKTFDPNFVS